MEEYKVMKELIVDRRTSSIMILEHGFNLCKKIIAKNPDSVVISDLFKSIDRTTKGTYLEEVVGTLATLKAHQEYFKFSATMSNKDSSGDLKYNIVRFLNESGKSVFDEIDKKDFKLEKWTSEEYILLKLIVERLSNEMKDVNKQIKKMKADGISLGEKKNAPIKYVKKKKKNITVDCFAAEIDHKNKFKNKYPKYEPTKENLEKITQLRNKIIFKYTPIFNFILRCIDYSINDAFLSFGLSDTWESGYKVPRGKLEWYKKEFPELEATFRFRTWKKKI